MGQISIHAAREGGDVDMGKVLIACEISIHAAREGGDGTLLESTSIAVAFQSTPPVKAATSPVLDQLRQRIHFNPRRP